MISRCCKTHKKLSYRVAVRESNTLPEEKTLFELLQFRNIKFRDHSYGVCSTLRLSFADEYQFIRQTKKIILKTTVSVTLTKDKNS